MYASCLRHRARPHKKRPGRTGARKGEPPRISQPRKTKASGGGMSIPTVRASVISYFHKFDLAAIAQIRDGRLVSTRDPSGHAAAWWLRAADIGPVLARARADSGGPSAGADELNLRACKATHLQLVGHNAAPASSPAQNAQNLTIPKGLRLLYTAATRNSKTKVLI